MSEAVSPELSPVAEPGVRTSQTPTVWTRAAVPVFMAWTLFVWGGRLRNLAAEPDGLGGAGRSALWGSVLFVTLALATLAARFIATAVVARTVLSALVALTLGVWLVRAADIAVEDHDAAFIAVHLVLACVSIGLGLLAVRADRSRSLTS